MTASRYASSTGSRFAGALGKLVAVGALGAAAIWAAPAILATANTVGSSAIGEGTGTVSGYTASAVDYTLGTNLSNVDAVAFTLNSTPPASATIKVKLVSSGSDWYTCTNVATAVTCVTTTPQATTSTVNELRLVVAD